MAYSLGSLLRRREFLRLAALFGLGTGLFPFAAGETVAAGRSRVRRYVALGRTGIRISDISFGSSHLATGGEDLIRDAYDRGINYFDTAATYTDGESETVIGNALVGKRDKVFIASKTLAGANARKAQIMAELDGSLRRLRTDYVDVYFLHAVNRVARLRNPEWHEFVELARKQGKIRFTGMSGHAGRLAECLDFAINSDRFDVILVAYNFGQDPAFYQRFLRSFDMVAIQPDLPRLLKRARERNVGVIAMKTLMGARLNDMRPYETAGATFAQAAFRWVLSNSDVDALIVTLKSRAMIDEYLGASGARAPGRADAVLLKRYMAVNSVSYCRQGCGLCESACPNEVAIGDVLRARMYACDYGDPRLARSEYARLGTDAAACLGCTAKPCAGACPYGVATEQLMPATHALLG